MAMPNEALIENIKQSHTLPKDAIAACLKCQKNAAIAVQNDQCNFSQKYNDFEFTLKFIKKAIKQAKIQPPIRVQFSVSHGVHWLAIDIQFLSAEEINMIVIDAAGDTRWKEALKTVTRVFAEIRCFAIEGNIQWDSSSCSIISLDHVIALGKIADLHEYLINKIPEFTQNSCSGVCYYQVSYLYLPSRLIALTQKAENIERYLNSNEKNDLLFFGKSGQLNFLTETAGIARTTPYELSHLMESKKDKFKYQAIELISQSPHLPYQQGIKTLVQRLRGSAYQPHQISAASHTSHS